MKKLILVVFLLSSCTISVKPDAEVEAKLAQHQAILTAITAYVAELQEKGALPKPEKKE